MALSKEIKEKWIKALNSGEFKQGKYKLHDEEEDVYCCLGVLCKITDGPLTGGFIGLPHALHLGTDRSPTISTKLLTDEEKRILYSYGLPHYAPYVSLVGLNDNASFSFKRIAELIEQSDL